jgi:hypothetical protein
MPSLPGLLDCSAHRANLNDRVEKVEVLLRETHQAGLAPEVGQTARGVTMVLLFAAYEQLLTSLCRSLLETASTLRVGVRRLTPGFKVFAVFEKLQGVSATSLNSIWKKHGPEMIEILQGGQVGSLTTTVFPADGSFMRASQVTLFCSLFGLPAPGPVLKEMWGGLDTVVIARNDIAHGTLPADEVGRRYTYDEMLAITYLWKVRWTEFLDLAEQEAAHRDFYRTKR